jgi:hypothetical protein
MTGEGPRSEGPPPERGMLISDPEFVVPAGGGGGGQTQGRDGHGNGRVEPLISISAHRGNLMGK